MMRLGLTSNALRDLTEQRYALQTQLRSRQQPDVIVIGG
jgi:hypothetical protein